MDSLRARCKALMEERDAALRQCTQLQHKVLCMDRNVESLGTHFTPAQSTVQCFMQTS